MNCYWCGKPFIQTGRFISGCAPCTLQREQDDLTEQQQDDIDFLASPEPRS